MGSNPIGSACETGFDFYLSIQDFFFFGLAFPLGFSQKNCAAFVTAWNNAGSADCGAGISNPRLFIVL
jgi:hypothetical protein